MSKAPTPLAIKEHAPEVETDLFEAGVTGVTSVTPRNGAACSVTPADAADVSAVTVDPFPAPAERPQYVVLTDWTEYDGRRYRPGVWHAGLNKPPRGETAPVPVETWICSPLTVEAVTHDQHGGEFGRLLRFKPTRGDWREWAMPQELLAGSGEELRRELLRQGVEIDPQSRNQLAQYLQANAPRKFIECATQTGWSGDSFVLPDTVIGPGAASITFQSVEDGSNEYVTGGSLEGWRDEVAALASGNPVLLVGLSVAFAGPLLKKCHVESGGIHLIGDSSTGKTTVAAAAASVYGPESYRRSWRTTSNGLEGAAALFNDCLLVLDEISEADPRDVGACVYALGNGAGKQRASRTGGIRPRKRFCCSVLSTGERSIDAAMLEGGKRAKAGQSVRLLDIPVTRTHGAWDTLHGLTAAGLSDSLKTAAAKHYGHAGRAYLERLAFDARDFAAALEQLLQAPGFQSLDGQHKRAARRLAIIGLAGELATEYGLTGWQEGEALAAAVELFKVWCDHRGHGPSERRQILENVRDFIDRHCGARFSQMIKGCKTVVPGRAGWWREDGGRRVYLFTGGGLREAVGGYDLKHALHHLLEAGALIDCGAGEKSKSHRTSEGPKRLYTIDPEQLEAISDGT
jgi:putative DNA primase/helicase